MLFRSREINLHTFDNVGARHVDDCASVAVAKTTVPGFDIRDAGGVQSNWRGKGRNRLFGVRDARGGTVQCEEVSGRGDGAAGDSGAMFIGYPA